MRNIQPEIEIVAIHGLGGGRTKTFTSASGNVLWLKDFLPHDPLVAPMNPRISTFGYDTSVAFGDSASQIHTFAEQFLNELCRTRRESETTGVPIIIIAHSLGGIVAKQALIMAQDPEMDYGEIKESVKGVVFMGTPHLVSEVAAKQYLQDLAKPFRASNSASSNYIDVRTESYKEENTS
ncbi:hypothetical protein BDD12DRAFT_116294 [Trichophaea hybrida]|nr:hypothetical protein BDD12DRAFT_116294 [Trichophaea hybrida]